MSSSKTILITGSAGFIGAAISKCLLSKGYKVVGVDNINNYYDVKLKEDRLKNILKDNKKNLSNWKFFRISIEDPIALEDIFKKEKPNIVINLAAQAGVRYSLQNPSAFIKTNLLGFGNILEKCRSHDIENLIYASSSSVYGGNKNLPYDEKKSVDHPVSLYAATKKSNELMAHTYSHNYNLPCTGLRFFTVYGPWGRPDMAPIIFTKSILARQKINVNNYGKMSRDFTYISDIVEGIYRCCLKPATPNEDFNELFPEPDSSKAPHRIFNIGSNRQIGLMRFIEIIENNLNIKAKLNLCELPPGDVLSTFANTDSFFNWVGYKAVTSIEDGMAEFIKWYLDYYNA